jgi:membrane-associated phospholipid phosphatase
MGGREAMETDSWSTQVVLGLALTTTLVIVAYFFVDQPLLLFIHDHKIDQHRSLKWLTRPPEVFVLLSLLVLIVGLVHRRLALWTWPERVVVAAALSTLLTVLAAGLLKITFGRASPIFLQMGGDGPYGFYPFQIDHDFWALPSGHTACTVSVTAVLGAAVPRLRLLGWMVAAVVAAALVALNFHFLGDIFAGAFLGWIIGTTTARRFGLVPPSQP